MKRFRIENHPVMGLKENTETVTIFYNGKPLLAEAGDNVSTALMAQGIRIFRHTKKSDEPRGIFCAIGRCTDCMMTIDGKENVRSCIMPVREGMVVEEASWNRKECAEK
jgi:NADH dehydrogenase/NADH:ubiquinone oxidoreductase subunit G